MKKIAISLVGIFMLLIGTNLYAEVEVSLNLSSSDGPSMTSLQRLATGTRINRASFSGAELSDADRDGVYESICFPITETISTGSAAAGFSR